MLSGLLFAIDDADDRPGRLTATLPFAGVTLIEYQARLLMAAGAAQIIIVVARLTPELLGAIARIAQRGVVVDTVRSAVEAAEKLHPLSRLVVLADGLITTEDTIAMVLRDTGHDALIVLPEAAAEPGWSGWADTWPGPGSPGSTRAGWPRSPRCLATMTCNPPCCEWRRRPVQRISCCPPMPRRRGTASCTAPRRWTRVAVRSWPGWCRDGAAGSIAMSWRRSRGSPCRAWSSVPCPRMLPGGRASGWACLGLVLILFGFPALGLFAAVAGTLGLGLGETLAGLRDEQGRPAPSRRRSRDWPRSPSRRWGGSNIGWAVMKSPRSWR